MQVVEEAYKMVRELVIPVEELVEARIWRLAAGVHEAKEEMAKV